MFISMSKTLYALILFLMTNQGNSVTLTTQPVSRFAHLQDSVTFKCRVEGNDFNVHDHSPVWYKVQDDDVLFALAKRLVDSSVKKSLQNRVEITVDKWDAPGEESVFTLKDIITEDTGKYECRVGVEGNRSVVQHELHVIESIESLNIYASDNSSVDVSALLAGEPVNSGSEVEFDSSTPGTIQCVATANSLEPTVSIYVDGHQSSGHYEFSSKCIWEGSTPLMKAKVCTTMRGDNGFRPPGHMSGKIFECKAEVHQDVDVLTTSVTIIVKGHPSVISDKCPNLVYAQVGQENMELRCVVHANPRTDYIGWRVDASGEMVTTLNSKDGYSTSDQSIGDHRQEIRLVIDKVTANHFHDYTLVLRNSNGETRQKITLQESGESQAVTAGFSVKASYVITAALAIFGVLLV